MLKNRSKEENLALVRSKFDECRSEKLLRQIPESESFSRRIYCLLHRPTRGQYQGTRGSYCRRIAITHSDFERHLAGKDFISLAVAQRGKAAFLAIDLDADFERRLAIFADVLRRRGLGRAAFAIPGSGTGRGKVVVTLRQRLPQRQARALVESIAAEVTADPRFGPYKSNALTTWPQQGDGGCCRLFGVNLKRATMQRLGEAPLDLNGDLWDLYSIEPADIAPETYARTRSRSSLSQWAENFIEGPYQEGTAELFSAQVRLAREIVALHGKAKAVSVLTEAFRKIEEQSPDISTSSRRNLLRSDVVARVIEYAGSPRLSDGNLISSDYIWLPKNNTKTPRGAVRVTEALFQYVSDQGLDPNCMGITFDRIAELADYSGKGKAWAALQQAVTAGFILVLDRGVPKQDGRPGLCGLYAIVGNHNPAIVFAAAQASPEYAKRNRERIARGLEPLPMPGSELPEAA